MATIGSGGGSNDNLGLHFRDMAENPATRAEHSTDAKLKETIRESYAKGRMFLVINGTTESGKEEKVSLQLTNAIKFNTRRDINTIKSRAKSKINFRSFLRLFGFKEKIHKTDLDSKDQSELDKIEKAAKVAHILSALSKNPKQDKYLDISDKARIDQLSKLHDDWKLGESQYTEIDSDKLQDIAKEAKSFTLGCVRATNDFTSMIEAEKKPLNEQLEVFAQAKKSLNHIEKRYGLEHPSVKKFQAQLNQLKLDIKSSSEEPNKLKDFKLTELLQLLPQLKQVFETQVPRGFQDKLKELATSDSYSISDKVQFVEQMGELSNPDGDDAYQSPTEALKANIASKVQAMPLKQLEETKLSLESLQSSAQRTTTLESIRRHIGLEVENQCTSTLSEKIGALDEPVSETLFSLLQSRAHSDGKASLKELLKDKQVPPGLSKEARTYERVESARQAIENLHTAIASDQSIPRSVRFAVADKLEPIKAFLESSSLDSSAMKGLNAEVSKTLNLTSLNGSYQRVFGDRLNLLDSDQVRSFRDRAPDLDDSLESKGSGDLKKMNTLVEKMDAKLKAIASTQAKLEGKLQENISHGARGDIQDKIRELKRAHKHIDAKKGLILAKVESIQIEAGKGPESRLALLESLKQASADLGSLLESGTYTPEELEDKMLLLKNKMYEAEVSVDHLGSASPTLALSRSPRIPLGQKEDSEFVARTNEAYEGGIHLLADASKKLTQLSSATQEQSLKDALLRNRAFQGKEALSLDALVFSNVEKASDEIDHYIGNLETRQRRYEELIEGKQSEIKKIEWEIRILKKVLKSPSLSQADRTEYTAKLDTFQRKKEKAAQDIAKFSKTALRARIEVQSSQTPAKSYANTFFGLMSDSEGLSQLKDIIQNLSMGIGAQNAFSEASYLKLKDKAENGDEKSLEELSLLFSSLVEYESKFDRLSTIQKKLAAPIIARQKSIIDAQRVKLAKIFMGEELSPSEVKSKFVQYTSSIVSNNSYKLFVESGKGRYGAYADLPASELSQKVNELMLSIQSGDTASLESLHEHGNALLNYSKAIEHALTIDSLPEGSSGRAKMEQLQLQIHRKLDIIKNASIGQRAPIEDLTESLKKGKKSVNGFRLQKGVQRLKQTQLQVMSQHAERMKPFLNENGISTEGYSDQRVIKEFSALAIADLKGGKVGDSKRRLSEFITQFGKFREDIASRRARSTGQADKLSLAMMDRVVQDMDTVLAPLNQNIYGPDAPEHIEVPTLLAEIDSLSDLKGDSEVYEAQMDQILPLSEGVFSRDIALRNKMAELMSEAVTSKSPDDILPQLRVLGDQMNAMMLAVDEKLSSSTLSSTKRGNYEVQQRELRALLKDYQGAIESKLAVLQPAQQLTTEYNKNERLIREKEAEIEELKRSKTGIFSGIKAEAILLKKNSDLKSLEKAKLEISPVISEAYAKVQREYHGLNPSDSDQSLIKHILALKGCLAGF